MDVPYFHCNYPIRCRTSCSPMKLPDQVEVGLQQYSARTFHVTLSPRVYKDGQQPPRNITTPKAIQATIQDVRYYAPRDLNLSKPLCSLHHRVPELVDQRVHPKKWCPHQRDCTWRRRGAAGGIPRLGNGKDGRGNRCQCLDFSCGGARTWGYGHYYKNDL